MKSENTTAPSKAQEQTRESDVRELIAVIPCIQGVEPPMQLLECATKGLAVEVMEMLRPVFPGAKFCCFEVAVTESLDARRRGMEHHKDLVLSCREADYPGDVYLERLHMNREVKGINTQGGAQ
ncbi:hypothetical protein [Pseudomonas petrae]|uniref:hypothetical protein n=1 Tax=Pseudomonas petrae TaxID=2912190 RepID=UPI001F2AA86D|nr:hypothetical protein [Pseudomonas petrae]MCF7558880.1 hypothetical protein [Pseudomonas petrae]